MTGRLGYIPLLPQTPSWSHHREQLIFPQKGGGQLYYHVTANQLSLPQHTTSRGFHPKLKILDCESFCDQFKWGEKTLKVACTQYRNIGFLSSHPSFGNSLLICWTFWSDINSGETYEIGYKNKQDDPNPWLVLMRWNSRLCEMKQRKLVWKFLPSRNWSTKLATWHVEIERRREFVPPQKLYKSSFTSSAIVLSSSHFWPFEKTLRTKISDTGLIKLIPIHVLSRCLGCH